MRMPEGQPRGPGVATRPSEAFGRWPQDCRPAFAGRPRSAGRDAGPGRHVETAGALQRAGHSPLGHVAPSPIGADRWRHEGPLRAAMAQPSTRLQPRDADPPAHARAGSGPAVAAILKTVLPGNRADAGTPWGVMSDALRRTGRAGRPHGRLPRRRAGPHGAPPVLSTGLSAAFAERRERPRAHDSRPEAAGTGEARGQGPDGCRRGSGPPSTRRPSLRDRWCRAGGPPGRAARPARTPQACGRRRSPRSCV